MCVRYLKWGLASDFVLLAEFTRKEMSIEYKIVTVKH